MRTAYKIWSGIAAGQFCIVAVTDIAAITTTPTPTAASTGTASRASAAPTSTAETPPTTAELAASAPQAGELVTVTKVVDGDTIEITGGRTVRFVSIDACEMSTRGGREAKDVLEFHVSGQQVRLVADGRRDTDDYGRLLRRVERTSSSISPHNPYAEDVGVTMISDTAVGLCTRKNDATPAYLAELREHDFGQRDCSRTPEAPSVGGSHDSRDRNMPDGALTGGFCGPEVVVLMMSARNIAALTKLVGVMLLVALALMILKWALITAAILIVPFGIWWIWDRIHAHRSRRADAG